MRTSHFSLLTSHFSLGKFFLVLTVLSAAFFGCSSDGGGGGSPDLYTITIDSGISHGTITANKTSAAAGEEITLTVTPEAPYYHLTGGSLKYNGTVGIDETTKTFSMPAFDISVSADFKLYEVRETGPAGGWVFYDKGNDTGGWRYLECAPADVSSAVQWGAYGTAVGGTDTAIGTGQANTAAILAKFETLNETGRAAQLCDGYTAGGYSDWFLPGKDELNLMYTVLHAEGIGGFSSALYWSSSELDSSSAWYQHFGYGGQNFGNKYSTYYVRPVRAF